MDPLTKRVGAESQILLTPHGKKCDEFNKVQKTSFIKKKGKGAIKNGQPRIMWGYRARRQPRSKSGTKENTDLFKKGSSKLIWGTNRG